MRALCRVVQSHPYGDVNEVPTPPENNGIPSLQEAPVAIIELKLNLSLEYYTIVNGSRAVHRCGGSGACPYDFANL